MLYNLPADYSIDCDAGVSARAVSSNSKPEPDVLLLAVAGVGICAGGAEEAESGGAAAKGGVVWFVAGCFVLLPPCAGVIVLCMMVTLTSLLALMSAAAVEWEIFALEIRVALMVEAGV